MEKNMLKKIGILSVSLFFTEVINILTFLLCQFLSPYFISKYILSNDIYRTRDNVIYVVMAIVSLILYFIIGRMVFSKFSNEEKKYSAIIVSILMILSYPVSELLTEISGIYFIVHMIIGSPIAYVIAMPLFEYEINYFLSIIILGLLSPISVLLIWLFGKIGEKKSKNN